MSECVFAFVLVSTKGYAPMTLPGMAMSSLNVYCIFIFKTVVAMQLGCICNCVWICISICTCIGLSLSPMTLPGMAMAWAARELGASIRLFVPRSTPGEWDQQQNFSTRFSPQMLSILSTPSWSPPLIRVHGGEAESSWGCCWSSEIHISLKFHEWKWIGLIIFAGGGGHFTLRNKNLRPLYEWKGVDWINHLSRWVMTGTQRTLLQRSPSPHPPRIMIIPIQW